MAYLTKTSARRTRILEQVGVRDARTYEPVELTHGYSEFFEPLRQTRRERRLPPEAPRQRSALITIVHNEAFFLPIWLGYYSRFFAPEDIYVLDNDSNDGSTDRGGFIRIPATNDQVDHIWQRETIESLQHELLERYDVVMVADSDEIIAPHPDWGNLGAYLGGFAEEWVNCLGYEILHMNDREAPIRPDQPILDQRGHWFSNGAYNKPLVATVPMSWETGFHHQIDKQVTLDPDLYLIHLRRVDFDLGLARHMTRTRREWNPHDRDTGWAGYTRIVSECDFEKWFYSETGFEPLVELVVEPIPPVWKGTV